MTSEITEAMVEAGGNKLIGYGTDHGWFRCPATMTEFFEHDPIGHSEFQAIVAQVIEAALAARPAPVSCVACEDNPKAPNDPCAVCGKSARPAPEARSVVERYGVDGEWMRYSSHATALAEANEKIDRLERERAALHAAGKDAHLSILKEEQARIERLKKALRALEEANDRLASARSTAIYNSLIDAGLADILMALDDARRDARAALQQEGESDGI